MRNKKESAISEESKQQAHAICEDFSLFTDGYRVLFLILRHGDGGDINNTHLKKIIVSNPKEYEEALSELIEYKNKHSEIPFRIYASANSRDFDKAIRKFKYEQLDADYFSEKDKQNFYLDIKNRFLGTLMQPSARAENNFIIDIDVQDDGDALKQLTDKVILKKYKTKNGWHIITKPFNPNEFNSPECEIKKDGLLLLSY